MAMIELVTESVEDSKKANRTPVATKKNPGRAAAATPVATDVPAAGDGAPDDAVQSTGTSEETPAEELVVGTEERDAATDTEQEPSDDVEVEEADVVTDGEPDEAQPRT
jgi:large subunit ribosomal protein L17